MTHLCLLHVCDSVGWLRTCSRGLWHGGLMWTPEAEHILAEWAQHLSIHGLLVHQWLLPLWAVESA